jgi:chromosome segregation ATPase
MVSIVSHQPSEASAMIEAVMYAGLGFLAASLLALLTIPLIHARAVRLTIRRLEAATPLSMAEIQADKDQLRAEFAMSTRRLEISVEQLKSKTTSQLAELGKKTDAINRLKRELGEQTASIFALEARDKALKEQLRAAEEELAAKTNALYEAQRALGDKQGLLPRLTSDVSGRGMGGDNQQGEIISLRTQVEKLKSQIAELEAEVREAEKRLALGQREAAAAAAELAAERGQVVRLGDRVAQLEHQLATQVAEAENLSERVTDLRAQLAQEVERVTEREHERDHLRLELAAVRQIEADLRQELATTDRRQSVETEALAAAKVLLESQLDRARDERAQLQQELATMTRSAEAAWAAERVENAVLRERINDVAAEVVRLTSVLEGPGSPIETILAQDVSRQQINGAPPAASSGEGESKGSLADRIRALQTRASRLSSA